MSTSISTSERQLTAGVVLAGGRSRRMGNADKSLLPWKGRTLIEQVVKRAQPQVARLVLNSNSGSNELLRLGLPVVADRTIAGVEAYSGPLAGIISAMHWCREQREEYRWLVSFATDTPFIPSDFVARCLARAGECDADIVYGQSAGRAHFAIALWNMDLIPQLEAQLRQGERALKAIMASHTSAACEFATEPVDPFFNINTPEDWHKAQEYLAHAEE